jgi:5-methylcytosine-specific restriction endonuclease McrA
MVPKKVLQKIKQRDSFRCIACGIPGSDIHHIVPRSQFGKKDERRDAIYNLCFICKSCHATAHTKQSRIDLLKIMKRRYKYEYTEYPWKKYIDE